MVKSCNMYIQFFLNSVSSANRRLMLPMVAPALASLDKPGDWGFQEISMNKAREFEPVGVGIDQDALVTPTKQCPAFDLATIEVWGITTHSHDP